MERIVSQGKHIQGYIDVWLDFTSSAGERHVVVIEVKSSAGVVARDTNDIVRQMKKYKFYEPQITDMFLVYGEKDSSFDKTVFTANGIKVLVDYNFYDVFDI